MNMGLQKIFRTDTYWAGLLLLLSAIFFVIMALISRGDYGGADSYWHYFITHYAFRYPGLFLHHWGKPLFTALSSPFSYFGFLGLQLFNILASLISACLAWRLGKKLGLQYSWLVIILTLFAPVYFMLVFSGLTENLCGLVLVWAVYLFFNKRFALAAIIISFIPYARTEGFIFLPLFALALAWNRKWPHMLLLFTGLLFYSIIGYFYYHDFFWTFTQNPYGNKSANIYGSGSLWSFASQYRELFGMVFTALLLVGIIEYLLPFFRRWNKKLPVDGILLIMLPVVLYFAAHSYVWWKGAMGSAGLTRVIAGIIPLAAVLGLKGFNVLLPLLNMKKWLKWTVIIPLSIFIIKEPFDILPIPFPTGLEERVFDKVYNWIKKEKPIENKLWVLHPYLVFKLDMNPYDGKTVGLNFPLVEELTKDTRPGDLMVWDAHFGPNEGRVPLESFMNNKYFELKAFFPSDVSFYNSQGMPYEIYVFRRTADTMHIDNPILLEKLKKENFDTISIYSNKFDTTGVYPDSAKNNACFRINKDLEYSPGMEKLMKETILKTDDNIEISVEIWPLEADENSLINFVASISHKNNVYLYQCYPIRINTLRKNSWNKKEFKFVLPSINDDRASFKAYLWNSEKNSMLMDNLNVKLIKSNQY
jgi:hypothetical protein